MITSPAFAGKKYAVLGLARSGLATVDALVASGAEVVAWDTREEARDAVADRAQIGDPVGADLTGYAGVVVAPGVPLNRHPIAGHAANYGVPVIGDIELFAQARADLPRHKVVGITGTNGKSTTTALVHHILKTAGVPTTMGGNIGLPILGQDPLPQGGVYVLELSSYQIDLTYSLDCDVAVLLEITPDHLDRYENMAAYINSKLRLFDMQSPDHLAAYYHYQLLSTTIRKRIGDGHRKVDFANDDEALVELQRHWPALQGPHNAQNAAAAMAVCIELDVGKDALKEGFRTYPGLPHRMERVAERNGILFVNDSKATNTESSAPALASYPHIHWIVGGLAKTEDLGPCAAQLGHVRAAYTIGEAGPMFARLLEGRVPVTQSELLVTAVKDAAAAARPGEVVLLSPACASFDQFRDYEARGQAFRDAVGALGE
ncbi:UDP-N-acetylmuramoyl-L-alanine--D-glutamate ligase [Sphingosinicella sp. LHD-64]|uniref:UDP-N-acetylmuramoyl-L-alanine--D-glutamate ligase n=1 Tax=Sphingosinicella sp. LHD-64 TaxID=3072139 RepID=UPI00280E2313|nr:UDP-N-acetylmuramoyl-L-alanine--D-glutamate ligase [Sphingosinicella sp. LHD-64]MDQ8758242.1 UDP-N-acetylmuramoyl-L-alanine--D-glutamate ligase [Sphingosinicella sp. LHD-64]